MPERLKPVLGEDSQKALQFKYIESKIFISLNVRSVALHNLHISEWCFCKDTEIQATMGAVSPETNVSGETTGNGVGNDGYITYQDAKLGISEYKTRFVYWPFQEDYRLPLNELDPKKIMQNLKPEEKKLQKLMKKEYNMVLEPEQVLYRRQAKRKLKTLFPQEMPEVEEDCFMTAGLHFFDLKKLMALLREAKEWDNEEKYYHKDDDYICFEAPNRKDVFVAGADTSEGIEDFNVLKIINVTKKREAFVFRARCGFKRFYKECYKWCSRYNFAYLGVEDNNTGHAVLMGLEENLRYPRLYKETNKTRIIQGKIKEKLGWHTDKNSRVDLCRDLKYAIEEDDDIDVEHFAPVFTIYDIELLKEGLTFIKKGDKYKAEEGKKDDTIFATGIAFQLYKIHSRRVFQNQRNMGVIVATKMESTNL